MDTDAPPLKGAQKRTRDNFFQYDEGLFPIDGSAGYGKSTTLERIAAEAFDRVAESTPSPEQSICVVSFSREDAASIAPGIEGVLTAFADPDQDTERTIDQERAEWLQRRVRRSKHIGTVDSIFRLVFQRIHPVCGFSEMPSVNDDSHLADLRADCIDDLRERERLAPLFKRLDAAYPSGQTDDTAADSNESVVDHLLESARREKRARRLTDAEFRDRLNSSIDQAYPNGEPSSFSDVVRDVEAFFGDEAVATFKQQHEDEEGTVVKREQACLAAWRERVDDFCTVLKAYEAAYDQYCRKQGMLTHLDVTYLVAEFFDTEGCDDVTTGDVAAPAASGDDEPATSDIQEFREHVRHRYEKHLQTLLIDEAQDISVAQHDALGQLVPDDARVIIFGDISQCVYGWRDGWPELFARAVEQGQYFGRTWPIHKPERAFRTYRMRPDISAAIDAVFQEVFTDPIRGAQARPGDEYHLTDAERNTSTGTSVHIAAYRGAGIPGSPQWFEESELDPLANYIHGFLVGDQHNTADEPCDSMTVLFRNRTNMSSLAARLEQKGHRVADASQRLFETDLVALVTAVVEWLVDPFDTERTRALIEETDIFTNGRGDDPSPTEIFEDYGYRLDDVATDDTLPSDIAIFVNALTTLREQQYRHSCDPGTLVIEHVVETLTLRTDPFDQVDDERRCLSIIDTLLESVRQWEATDRYSVRELAGVLRQYTDDPSKGPSVPVSDGHSYDVVFCNIHNMKGDEDDTICIADLSQSLGTYGPHDDSFIARGETLALRPPETASPVSVMQQDTPRDQSSQSLRWTSFQWIDGSPPRIAGPPVFSDVALAHRAEEWRVLYVAMTRARDHLILSLPNETTTLDTPAPDSWIKTIWNSLDLPSTLSANTFETSLDRCGTRHTLEIGALDVPHQPPRIERTPTPTPRCARTPASLQTGFTPRFINGSDFHLLTSDFENHWRDYLKGKTLSGDRTENDVGSEIDLPFEAVSPDVFGTVAHKVLATAAARRLPTETLENCADPLDTKLRSALDAHAPAATEKEREKVATVIRETVCPQFADTDTWVRLQKSRAVYVEEPLDGMLNIGDHTVETRNAADIVSQGPDGMWYVDELKTVLTAPDDVMRNSHSLQATFYRELLEKQIEDDSTVTACVTLTGQSADSTVATPPIVSIQTWLERLA